MRTICAENRVFNFHRMLDADFADFAEKTKNTQYLTFQRKQRNLRQKHLIKIQASKPKSEFPNHPWSVEYSRTPMRLSVL